MSDQDKQRPQAKKPAGAGGKDSRLQKRNKNVTAAFSDRNKENELAAEVSKQLLEQEETVFEPWQRNVIKLQSQGWSFERIIEVGEERRRQTGIRPKRIVWPSRTLLYTSMNQRPEFREACEKAFAFACDAEAQRTLELAKSLDGINGLRPNEIVNARDKRIQRTLQVAGRIMPDKWGELAEADREVIVFEPYGGWVPTNLARGVPTQGAEAETAAERWAKMRREAKDA